MPEVERPALVLGSAACLWSDLAALPEGYVGGAWVIAVNWAGVAYLHRIDYWAGLHPDILAAWRGRREGPDGFATVAPCRPAHAAIDIVFGERWGGSSGLYGVQFALEILRAKRVTLVGVPIDGQDYVHGGAWRFSQGTALPRYRSGWRKALPDLQGRVGSMSGWTRELLGAPEF